MKERFSTAPIPAAPPMDPEPAPIRFKNHFHNEASPLMSIAFGELLSTNREEVIDFTPKDFTGLRMDLTSS